MDAYCASYLAGGDEIVTSMKIILGVPYHVSREKPAFLYSMIGFLLNPNLKFGIVIVYFLAGSVRFTINFFIRLYMYDSHENPQLKLNTC